MLSRARSQPLAMPELHTVDFAPQRQSQADCSVFSGEVTRPADALDPEWLARIGRDADQFFEL